MPSRRQPLVDPLRIRTFTPSDLASLFSVFSLLENGTSVLLQPETSNPQPSHLIPEITTHNGRQPSPPLLGFYSSGSTGSPKLFWHSWTRLKSEVRLTQANFGWTWASPFSAVTFAGVQVALQAWASRGEILSLGSDWTANWNLLANRSAQALSCTPTFLDVLLLQTPNTRPFCSPLQITLGGEPLRPAAGDRFRKAFPKSRFTVIYASAEFGVLLKTNRLDGWYELAPLRDRYPRWQVEDGELQLWSDGSWRSTHDLVEINNGLIRIIGRADAVANVAGHKVNLEEVSRAAEEVPGVRAALAYAEANAVSGQAVVLRFTPDAGFVPAEVEQGIKSHLRQHLRKEAWPRRWEIGTITVGPNSKRSNLS